ncbi:hypothetical protein J6590_019401 [Homalodisca vitripennis]|nr:hypothetical protein J6590_019401 [Homalodisca vitripennis]
MVRPLRVDKQRRCAINESSIAHSPAKTVTAQPLWASGDIQVRAAAGAVDVHSCRLAPITARDSRTSCPVVMATARLLVAPIVECLSAPPHNLRLGLIPLPPHLVTSHLHAT